MPFTCNQFGYQVAGTPNSNLTQIDLVTGETTVLSPDIGLLLNGVGYNTLDNYIYGIQTGTNQTVQLDSDGTAVNLGAPPNLPSPTANYNVGTMDLDGRLYITDSSNFNRYYVIDLAPGSPTYNQLVDPTNGYAPDTAPYGTAVSGITTVGGDWVFNPVDGLLYSMRAGFVSILDPTTGVGSAVAVAGLPSGTYGAQFIDGSGTAYAIRNSTGVIYRISTDGMTISAEPFAQGTASNNNDGTNCPLFIIQVDYGDAPDTSAGNGPDDYTTTLANDGPRHLITGEALYLGTQVTGEDDALQNADATGDDIPEGIPDDGVSLPLPVLETTATTYSITETVTNNTGEDALLYAWVDFNQDGVFQANEAATGTPIVVPSTVAGTQDVVLNFTVPAGVTPEPDHTFVRVRLTTDELTNTNGSPTEEDTRSTGAASDGEVEDYYLEVSLPVVRGALFI
ncbi:DUF6923 family protein [Paenibacillus sp. strain BS8-2]